MSIKGNFTNTSILITLSILTLLLVPSSTRINIVLDKTAMIAFGQVNKIDSNFTKPSPIAPENIQLKKVHVGDIDIAYKALGKGKPLLLIAGSGATMDMWDPTVLKQLSANHTVIIFDNRGKGQTSVGTIPIKIFTQSYTT